ncbi:glycosyltransferase, group 2 family protein [Hallella bergensis DSM 17361]|uniref:Glycosyltransferase, group 2 family protein n=1 Tax=Hallella bergensis DSM 17361 TaxID=585502 RepID=D1PWS0_9BACT|nr:glycosyltransferase family 2 protein [Hallella bergensis]EFA44157.1 glycosyltransferase, group 2 family protein [Hallella bergensis DSM 17361]
MHTAIVILNWNGAHMMKTYLPTVLDYSQDEGEVWVADNASTDNSMDMLRRDFPQVRTLQLDQNYGFAEGYNRALSQIEADYYVLLNSDVEVTPGWLTTLRSYMDAHPEVAACQPKLLSVFARDKFEYAGASGGLLDKYGYPFCRGRIFDTVETDRGQYDDVAQIHWATGACLMVRAEDYWRVGGLDGRFFAHNEEIDFCWRLRLLGGAIVCVPQSVVYHVGGGTLPKGNPMKTFLNFRNNLTMLYKNLPDDQLSHVMRVRCFLDYLAAFQTLILNRNVADFKAIIKARRAFRKWRHSFDADRADIQSRRVPTQVDELAPLSIIWQYYVRKQKQFTIYNL